MHRAALILFFVAGPALAHPNHGAGGWLSAQLLHLLTEPDHLAMILAPPLIAAIAIGVWRRRRGIRRLRKLYARPLE